MVPYLGGQLTFEEVKRYYEGRQGYPPAWTPSLLRIVRSVRSFPVLPLTDVRVVCRPDEFDLQIPSLYAGHLPSVAWGSSFNQRERYSGLVEKYHILDVAYIAARDEATNQNMMLELGGRVSGLDGSLEHGQPFPETVVVTITHAHWANVSGLGVGVGFYM